MKRFFQIIGLISLLSFSFFYTEKTVSIVKEMDTLMNEIKINKDNYYKKPIDAIINNNYIIPGLSGREVDIDSSYEIIKKVGVYSPNLLVIKNINPEVSYINQYDKYIISGNKEKKEVTFIFKIESNNINKIINILKNNNIKASFFLDKQIYKNEDIINNLIKNNHIIIYNDKNNYINKITTSHYCYTEKDNKSIIEKCIQNKSYTIKPNVIIQNNPLIEIKKNINNGSIISFNINNKTEQELELIIQYIKSKGYIINNLNDFLKE